MPAWLRSVAQKPVAMRVVPALTAVSLDRGGRGRPDRPADVLKAAARFGATGQSSIRLPFTGTMPPPPEAGTCGLFAI